ncbi:uncharacterized protein N7482_004684 [Penicillium canariense]|uniref:Uncharacterized protein n=1 Tax=Penicillium canariense TaxID=189055 RepID=A0A9W9LQJ4_9EURO|nr:uncharacterized protein N7482_004684 [Penicillium canariense]KAJ5169090.1 hypothetical protein N7482_004684 [Penicillium canariense]
MHAVLTMLMRMLVNEDISTRNAQVARENSLRHNTAHFLPYREIVYMHRIQTSIGVPPPTAAQSRCRQMSVVEGPATDIIPATRAAWTSRVQDSAGSRTPIELHASGPSIPAGLPVFSSGGAPLRGVHLKHASALWGNDLPTGPPSTLLSSPSRLPLLVRELVRALGWAFYSRGWEGETRDD